MNNEQPRKAAPRLKLRVTAAAEAALRAGHPWVFAEAIRQQSRPGQTGELAVIYDRQDRFLAVGLFDADSPIRLRALQAGRPEAVDASWWARRLDHALERRRGLFDDQTTGCRWIHGENDGWPGLVLDRYDTTLVLKLYTAAWLPRLDDIAALFIERLRPQRLVLRLSRNIAETARQQCSRTDGQLLHGAPPAGPVVFLESGLRFEADVLRGQKTGFFLDQRENRRRIEGLARGRRVLDAFSFSGGFSLYAARGGASAVTDLDLSAHALAGAERNFALNQGNAAVARCARETVQAEAFEWLGGNAERRFDLIILDPPSLAKRQADQAGAIRAYERLAGLGLARLAPRGILAACSCSAHVSAEEFFGAVRQAVARSGRRAQELQTTGHPPDHPAVFKEARYLKAIFFELVSGRGSPVP
ncbi:MAG TPA: class I SAM-dependent methyltransferase [Dongiaceae bacterium]|nr:class I SAM-dependent methyltransferase [Dongiaceae bacterium]